MEFRTLQDYQRAGLLSLETDEGANEGIGFSRSQIQARCTSVECAGGKAHAYQIKDVPYPEVDCPDCGSILFWQMPGERRKRY